MNPSLSRKIQEKGKSDMSYKIVGRYTPDMADKDVIVFLKTNFQSPILNDKGKVVKWVRDADNYVYGMFPHRRMGKQGMTAETYVKPEGSILTWRDKLRVTETMELDALSEDLPASWEEYSDLLTKLVVDHTVGDGVIVIEDAATWQKVNDSRKRVLRKQMEDVLKGGGIPSDEIPVDAPIIDPYPLAICE